MANPKRFNRMAARLSRIKSQNRAEAAAAPRPPRPRIVTVFLGFEEGSRFGSAGLAARLDKVAGASRQFAGEALGEPTRADGEVVVEYRFPSADLAAQFAAAVRSDALLISVLVGGPASS